MEVKMVLVIKSGNTNCFLLQDEVTSNVVLIDAGHAADKDFMAKLQATQLINEIDFLILTHGHYDHVGHAGFLQEQYGIKIVMHQHDAESVKQGKMNFPPANSFLGNIVRITSIKEMSKARYNKFTPDIIVTDEEYLPDFDSFRIVHLPGHTSGSIGVLFNDCLFAGDLVMNMPLPSASIFADDFCLLQASIAKAETLNAKIVYPSHGRPFSSKWLKRL